MTAARTRVGTATQRTCHPTSYRYGIFLRPPLEVAAPALRMMDFARDVYGFRAARAYPPHITLLGSIVLNGEEDELIGLLDQATAGVDAVTLHGFGLDAPIGAAVGIDYRYRADGSLNDDVVALYERLWTATAPVRGFEPSDRKAEHRRAHESPEHFRAHLTILGHDGADNLALRDEAKRDLERLADQVPVQWTADVVTLYRFWSDAWHDRYWHSQEWIPLRSWRLAPRSVDLPA